MEVKTSSTEETKQLAKQIAPQIRPMDIIALVGELGAGKTTFTGFLAEALGFTNRVQSPTFVLVRKYQKKNSDEPIRIINHIDLYRITDASQLVDLDLNEYFFQDDAVTIIEWPDIAQVFLPERLITIKIDILGETERMFNVQNLH